MDIFFIVDLFEYFKIYKDLIYVMMVEVVWCGYVVYVCELCYFVWMGLVVEVDVWCIMFVGELDDLYCDIWFDVGLVDVCCFELFGVVLMCKDLLFDMEYVMLMWLFELVECVGVCVFNKVQLICDYLEKFVIGEFLQFVVLMFVMCDVKWLCVFYVEYGDVILKLFDGMGGMGVFCVKLDGMNFGLIVEMLSYDGMCLVMVQKFIFEIKVGDKCILLIGGELVLYLFVWILQGSEVCGNFVVGGFGVVQLLMVCDCEIVDMFGFVFVLCGLLLVGFDVIGDWLIEVNVMSLMCFCEIMEQMGFDVVVMFIDVLECVVVQV